MIEIDVEEGCQTIHAGNMAMLLIAGALPAPKSEDEELVLVCMCPSSHFAKARFHGEEDGQAAT